MANPAVSFFSWAGFFMNDLLNVDLLESGGVCTMMYAVLLLSEESVVEACGLLCKGQPQETQRVNSCCNHLIRVIK